MVAYYSLAGAGPERLSMEAEYTGAPDRATASSSSIPLPLAGGLKSRMGGALGGRQAAVKDPEEEESEEGEDEEAGSRSFETDAET